MNTLAIFALALAVSGSKKDQQQAVALQASEKEVEESEEEEEDDGVPLWRKALMKKRAEEERKKKQEIQEKVIFAQCIISTLVITLHKVARYRPSLKTTVHNYVSDLLITHSTSKHHQRTCIPVSTQEEAEKSKWADVPAWKRAVIEKREIQRYLIQICKFV